MGCPRVVHGLSTVTFFVAFCFESFEDSPLNLWSALQQAPELACEAGQQDRLYNQYRSLSKHKSDSIANT